jgi:hypothetical protein
MLIFNLPRHLPPLRSSSHLQQWLAHSSNHRQAAMHMKGPEQWLAIVRSLGMFYLLLLFYFQFYFDYLQINYVISRNGSTTTTAMTPDTTPTAMSLPLTLRGVTANGFQGRKQGRGVTRDADASRVRGPQRGSNADEGARTIVCHCSGFRYFFSK